MPPKKPADDVKTEEPITIPTAGSPILSSASVPLNPVSVSTTTHSYGNHPDVVLADLPVVYLLDRSN